MTKLGEVLQYIFNLNIECSVYAVNISDVWKCREYMTYHFNKQNYHRMVGQTTTKLNLTRFPCTLDKPQLLDIWTQYIAFNISDSLANTVIYLNKIKATFLGNINLHDLASKYNNKAQSNLT